uniref:RRM domain-containing protein n=1 Tax=Meloidogyne floridensis TaxID=298350 RepID=A0A915P328_9BILA
MEFASPPPLFNKNIYSFNNNKTPIFVFIVINEEENLNLNNSRNTTTTNSSTPSSSLCSSSQLAKDLEDAYPDRNLLLMCNRRSLRQLLYPLCAQAFLAKLADEGEEQAFSARLPLPKLFHSFVPLFEELTFNTTNTSSSSSSPFSLNNEKQQLTTKQLFSTLNKEFVHFCQSFNNNNQQINKLNIEYIQQGYQSMLCTDTQSIDSKTIIRARGLPWQVSDLDVALFFAGLEIAKGGVILCLGPEGRRNGECLVKFETAEYRDWALERHRCHLRQRYIELYRSSADDFVRHAIGIDHCALNFAQLADQQSQQNFHQAMIVRMRGLPFSATEQQIRDFFSTDGLPSGILQEGVLFVQRPDGRPSGDAFVLFCDEQSGRRALLKHRQRMGTRYIELFRTTQAEVQQLFNSKQQIINAQQEKNLGGGGGGILTNNNLVNNNNQKTQTLITSTTSSASNGIINVAQLYIPFFLRDVTTLPPIFAPPISTSVATFIPFGKPTPPPFKNSRRRDCLRLRGLPYEAQVQQVVEFLGPHARHVLFQGVHMIYTSIGHPSGEAFIQMESEQAASNASQECHNKYMELGKKKR